MSGTAAAKIMAPLGSEVNIEAKGWLGMRRNYVWMMTLAVTGLVLVAAGCREAAVPPHSRAVDSAFTVAGRPIAPAVLNAYVARHTGFTSRDGEMRCAYIPLAQREERIFLQTLCLEIVAEGDSLVVGSGRGVPVALRLAPSGDSVRIVSHDVPEDGGGYAPSVERIFPEDVARRIFAYTGADTLERHLKADAERERDRRLRRRGRP